MKTIEEQAKEWRKKKDEIEGFEWTECPEELDQAIADFHKHALKEKIKELDGIKNAAIFGDNGFTRGIEKAIQTLKQEQ